MNITINNTQVEVVSGETLIESARRVGIEIPSLCYVKGKKHISSCMVCSVKDCKTGQIIPSCTTVPTEGMCIDAESEEVKNIRALSLELLLSDHRADCEAPCSMVCPKGLEIEQMLNLYDTGRHEDAYAVINATFDLPTLGCDDCKVPCEKVCRRASVDKAVPIRKFINELVEKNAVAGSTEAKKDGNLKSRTGSKSDKNLFQSRLGRFTVKEKDWLKKHVDAPSGCLHCACAGSEGCKLRQYATEAGIKRPRYGASSAAQVMKKQYVTGKMWFEPAKCIRCGLCVYNSNNGFTFKDRGFGMQIVIPDESRGNVGEELAELCPTGALYCV